MVLGRSLHLVCLELDEFVDAVRRVARGGTAIDPEVVAQLIGRPKPRDPVDDLIST